MICKKKLNYIARYESIFQVAGFPKLFKDNHEHCYKHDSNRKLVEKENDVKELNMIWESKEAFLR